MGINDNMGDAQNRTAGPGGAPERTDSESAAAVTLGDGNRNKLPDTGQMTRAGAQAQTTSNGSIPLGTRPS